ncbi:isopentenyl-diphosphate delta-isomerase [Halodesulfurarchaeum formicicum]|uniref:Isopentenyl-diphosphate Delta-isomerase n=1 Tax=Halodesulfurarchaeum formicicum TaxID=1873524 RepID=A0A1D8S2D6_9EURY|nr:isopentenyl-diphosphate Delta-isomerase [Halodesulfurarchaeum formicicum]AOW79493.1 isopentenyl-diphosphate delta-isomerase [Halodesulfurarchaeum formicicum]APE94745.1 isopentenyl-diphosphate delta-isomerase [Halodesulfurarchaeum formicicum]
MTDQSAPKERSGGEEVIAVDADDEPQGLVDRLEAHTGDGIRHRAFTCMLFDEQGRVLLAQRARNKRLWDTHWDGTVASHPTEGQTQIEATEERLEEELGVTPDQYGDLEITDRFEYKRYYLDEGLEWEVCAVLTATVTDPTLDPDPEEVGGTLWVDYEDLWENPRNYRQLRTCPWFDIAMRRDFRGDST